MNSSCSWTFFAPSLHLVDRLNEYLLVLVGVTLGNAPDHPMRSVRCRTTDQLHEVVGPRCPERCAFSERGLLLVVNGSQCAASARLLLHLSVSTCVPSCGAQALLELFKAQDEAGRADAEPI